LGDCLLFAASWKLQTSPTFLSYLYPQIRLWIHFDKKLGFGYMLADFSKTHLVTLGHSSSSSNDNNKLSEGPIQLSNVCAITNFRLAIGQLLPAWLSTTLASSYVVLIHFLKLDWDDVQSCQIFLGKNICTT
jgi:hypothetical protein